MRGLLIWTAILIPYTILGIYIGGKKYGPGSILAYLVALAVVVHVVIYQKHLGRKLLWWHKYYLLFMASALISTAFSPYFDGALARGAIQFVGISSMLCLGIAVADQVSREPGFFPILIRNVLRGLGVVAIIGIIQFITFNVLRSDLGFAQLMALNGFAGGEVYKMPTQLGSIYRPNSICLEPSHLGQFLGMGAGVSLIRLGILGQEMKRMISACVPRWTAVSILICFLLTLSIISYLLLALVATGLVLVSRRVNWRFAWKVGIILMLVGVFFGGMAKFAGPKFSQKMSSVKLFFMVRGSSVGTVNAEMVSALAITANIDVMLQNLKERPLFGVGMGAHPKSYLIHAPAYIRRPDMYRMNAVDAGGLLFRLLSETGFIGTAFYLAGLASLVLGARNRILYAIPLREEFKPLAIGLTASFIGVVSLYFFRWGHYYDLEQWVMMALLACIPILFQPRPDFGKTLSATTVRIPAPA